MGGVEPLVVLPVAALYLAVVPGCKGSDDLVADAVGLQMLLKERGPFFLARKAVGEFRPVIGLDTFDAARERSHQMLHELGGRIGAVFLKGFHETPAGVFVDGSVLEELFSNDFAVFQTGRRDKFHIHLETLARVVHLLVGFGDILGIGRMHGHDTLFSKDTVKTGNGAGVSALPELHPENDEAGMRIPAAHILDELDLISGMLIRMAERSSGAVTEGVPGAVIASFPTVDILSVGLIFDSRFGDTKFLSIIDQG